MDFLLTHPHSDVPLDRNQCFNVAAIDFLCIPFFSVYKLCNSHFYTHTHIALTTQTHTCVVLCEAMAQAMAKEKFFFGSLYVLSPLHCVWLRKKRKGANSNEAESFCGNIYILIILHICVWSQMSTRYARLSISFWIH